MKLTRWLNLEWVYRSPLPADSCRATMLSRLEHSRSLRPTRFSSETLLVLRLNMAGSIPGTKVLVSERSGETIVTVRSSPSFALYLGVACVVIGTAAIVSPLALAFFLPISLLAVLANFFLICRTNHHVKGIIPQAKV